MTGIEIMLTTMVAVVVGVVLIVWITNVVEGWLEAFRRRYTDRNTEWKAIDLLGVPTWLALEIVWVAFALLFALWTIWSAYYGAKTVRDWWHAGDQHKR